MHTDSLYNDAGIAISGVGSRSMVPTTVIPMLVIRSIPWLRRLLDFCIRRVLTVRPISDTRFVLTASGGSYLCTLCVEAGCQMGSHQGGTRSGWDQVRMGSGPDGIMAAKQGAVLCSRFIGELSDKLIFLPYGGLYCREDSTGFLRQGGTTAIIKSTTAADDEARRRRH